MNYCDFLSIVRETQITNPVWFGLECEPTATEGEISNVETHFSISLPEEYKLFVMKYGGGFFAFANVYSVNEESDFYIINQNNMFVHNNIIEFIAVSDNGCGDMYGFEISNGECDSKIVCYNHETKMIEGTEYKNLFDYLVKVGLKRN